MRRLRGWLGHALILAVVLKALIPAGFMPVFQGRGGDGIKIVICTAQGPKLVSAHDDGGPDNGALAKHASEICAFVQLAALTPPDVVVTLAPALSDDPAPTHDRVGTLPPARAGPANGSRAPPTLA